MFRTESSSTSGMDIQPPKLRPPPCLLSDMKENLHSGMHDSVLTGFNIKTEHESTSFSSVQETGDVQVDDEKMKGQSKVRDLLCGISESERSFPSHTSSGMSATEHEDSSQPKPGIFSRGTSYEDTDPSVVPLVTDEDAIHYQTVDSTCGCGNRKHQESHETNRKCLTQTQERLPYQHKGSPDEDDEPDEDEHAFFSSLPQSYIEVPRPQPLQCRTSNDLSALPETLSEPSAFWKQEGESGNESSNQRDSGFSSRSSQEIVSSVEGNISCEKAGLSAEPTPYQADGSQLSMNGNLNHPQLKLGLGGLPEFLSISKHSDREEEDYSQC